MTVDVLKALLGRFRVSFIRNYQSSAKAAPKIRKVTVRMLGMLMTFPVVLAAEPLLTSLVGTAEGPLVACCVLSVSLESTSDGD